jgi:hypothetical protein
MAMTGAAVISFHMGNVAPEVVRLQRVLVEKFAPSEVAIRQIETRLSHAAALDEFLANTEHDLVVFLDIDCVPLTPDAIACLTGHAAQGKLAGCAQRAGHILNGSHVYVGPFCMAITRQLWEDLGRPSFHPTERGDVGEEFTYRCEELGQPIHMLWPTWVENPLWDLVPGRRFGPNTEYGEAFLHTFGIRDPLNQRKFIDSCRVLVGEVESDRHYWHRYTDRYEQAFVACGDLSDILEFGVLDGASIQSLSRRFPDARIIGVDMVARKPSWPRGDRISYVQANQDDRHAIGEMFERLGRRFDLIIDDGSHVPEHQASCLIEGFPFLRAGGLYIVEDIHTSHPDHPSFGPDNASGGANCLHVLLALQHLKDVGQPLTPELASTLATPGYFSVEDLMYLSGAVITIELFKRTSLPLQCYACGSRAFDYRRFRCECGTDLYAAADSMSFLIRKADA